MGLGTVYECSEELESVLNMTSFIENCNISICQIEIFVI